MTPRPTRRRFCLSLAALATAGLPRAGPSIACAATDDEPRPEPIASPRHFEYVIQDGRLAVYDADAGHAPARSTVLPGLRLARGVVASAASGMLYVSYGNTGQQGSMLKYDLLADHVVWDHVYPYGVDSMAITPDGGRIYLPVGGWAGREVCLVVDADGGAILDEVVVGPVPHNALCGPSGAYVYVGASSSPYLYVIETATNQLARRVGPLGGGVRPFTVNGAETLAYVCVNGLLGFVVVDLVGGRLLHRVSPPGLSWPSDPWVCPSHGVALSPDEREAWVIDQPNNLVHIFDLTAGPAVPPRHAAAISLVGTLSGFQESGNPREGWLRFSRDGRFVYVGDAGDVIDPATRQTLTRLPALSNSRLFLEVDFEGFRPVFASSRHAVGYFGR